MTLERRIVFNLTEVTAVGFECLTCQAKVSLNPDKAEAPPDKCPAGHAWDWNVNTGYRSTDSPFRAFLSALGKLRDPLCERMGFRLLLEIKEP